LKPNAEIGGDKKTPRGGQKNAVKRVPPAPPLAALRSSALAPPTADESRRFALAAQLADAARACAGGDALAGAFTEKLRFASPASVARGHGWAAVTALSALCEAAFAETARGNRASPPRRIRSEPRAGASPVVGEVENAPSPEEKTPDSKTKAPTARTRKSLTLERDFDAGSPEAVAVEEEPRVAGAVAPSPESDRKSPERTYLEARSPSRRPASRAMRAAAAARARLAARNSWQRVFDPDTGTSAGGVVVAR
jgi:hypothetical protein